MTEPTYEYVKGKGWVVSPSGEFYVVFHTGDNYWRNIRHRGYKFSHYTDAKEQYDSEAPHFIARYPNWEFKIIPADGSEGVY